MLINISPTDTEVAPLWDPEKRQVIGLMTISDYIHAVQICRINNVPLIELASKTIHDMMMMPIMSLNFSEQQSIDAEDSLYQLYMFLERSGADYVSVINPDEGNLVSVLGYIDIINLLQVACKQQPQLFHFTIQNLLKPDSTTTVFASAKLADVLRMITDRGLVAVAIIDDHTHAVIGIYHKSDVTFIVRASEPETVINNLSNMTMSEVLSAQQHSLFLSNSDNTAIPSPRQYTLVKCTPHDYLSSFIDLLVINRVTAAVCVNENDMCIGLITITDILRFYFDGRNNLISSSNNNINNNINHHIGRS